MKTEQLKLKVADTVISFRSEYPVFPVTEWAIERGISERLTNFVYKEKKDIKDIVIDINIVEQLVKSENARQIFNVKNLETGSENWRLFEKDEGYIYENLVRDLPQVMYVNGAFDMVQAFVLPQKEDCVSIEEEKMIISAYKGMLWKIDDILYNFLQILLINYFARNKNGVFVHGAGIKTHDNTGIIFTGESGAGKSTISRIWNEHIPGSVLNDERVIVKKEKNKFFLHSTPWFGDFSDYLHLPVSSAPLNKIFFISHAAENAIVDISDKEAFILMYPLIFPVFWNKDYLENTVSFCKDMIKNTACYKLGFKNDKQVIEFINKIT